MGGFRALLQRVARSSAWALACVAWTACAPVGLVAGPEQGEFAAANLERTADSSCRTLVLVAYHSRDGHTERMARAVAEGARGVEGVRVELASVETVDRETLLAADGVVLGSPVYNGNVTPEMLAFINSWPFEGRPLQDRVGAAFVSAGGISAGEEAALHSLHRAMMIFGMVIVGGEDWRSAFGASAVVDEPPFAGTEAIAGSFLSKATGLGRRVASYARSQCCRQ